MILSFAGASPLVQVIAAAALGVIFCLVSKKLAFASLRPLGEAQTIRADAAELVGRRGIVVISIRGAVKRGLVNLSGEKWVAQAEGEMEFALGDEIEVASLIGQRVVVKASG